MRFSGTDRICVRTSAAVLVTISITVLVIRPLYLHVLDDLATSVCMQLKRRVIHFNTKFIIHTADHFGILSTLAVLDKKVGARPRDLES